MPVLPNVITHINGEDAASDDEYSALVSATQFAVQLATGEAILGDENVAIQLFERINNSVAVQAIRATMSTSSSPPTPDLFLINIEAALDSASPIAQIVYWSLISKESSLQGIVENQQENIGTALMSGARLKGYEWLLGNALPLGMLPPSLYFARMALLQGDFHEAEREIRNYEIMQKMRELQSSSTL